LERGLFAIVKRFNEFFDEVFRESLVARDLFPVYIVLEFSDEGF